MLCLVEIAQWFLRERYFIFVISLLSPSRKRCGPLFQETWVPFTQGCFVPSIVEIGPVILEKMKMWKVYRQRDRRTDDKRSEKLTWAVSSDELQKTNNNKTNTPMGQIAELQTSGTFPGLQQAWAKLWSCTHAGLKKKSKNNSLSRVHMNWNL